MVTHAPAFVKRKIYAPSESNNACGPVNAAKGSAGDCGVTIKMRPPKELYIQIGMDPIKSVLELLYTLG